MLATNVAGQYSLAMYDINGNFVRVLQDFIPQNVIPRGLVAIDSLNFLVSTDGVDQILNFNLLSGLTPHVSAADLAGNIYQMRRHPELGTFVIESNVIESFNDAGNRIGAPRVPATVGGCTLNVPRGLAITAQGYLVVTNTGNDDINVYDVSDPLNPVCVTANTALGNVDPVGVLAHSNGRIYVSTTGNDRIYEFNGDGSGAGVVIFNNIGVIADPTALLEMPDGSILVASDGTNSLVRITTDGDLVGPTNNFISDIFTNSISDMILLQEVE